MPGQRPPAWPERPRSGCLRVRVVEEGGLQPARLLGLVGAVGSEGRHQTRQAVVVDYVVGRRLVGRRGLHRKRVTMASITQHSLEYRYSCHISILHSCHISILVLNSILARRNMSSRSQYFYTRVNWNKLVKCTSSVYIQVNSGALNCSPMCNIKCGFKRKLEL